MEEKLLQIINHYGVLPQLKHFQSEVFELNEAIIDYENRKSVSNFDLRFFGATVVPSKEHIIEEIADIQFMLNQFKKYYKIYDSEIEEVMDFKGDRQLKRIKKERKQKNKMKWFGKKYENN